MTPKKKRRTPLEIALATPYTPQWRRIQFDVPIPTDEAFKKKCKELGITRKAAVLKLILADIERNKAPLPRVRRTKRRRPVAKKRRRARS